MLHRNITLYSNQVRTIYMRTPWTPKNPIASFWLRAANITANRARGHATAAVASAQRQLARGATAAWMDAWRTAITPKRRK